MIFLRNLKINTSNLLTFKTHFFIYIFYVIKLRTGCLLVQNLSIKIKFKKHINKYTTMIC